MYAVLFIINLSKMYYNKYIKEKRFSVKYEQSNLASNIQIIADSETGVNYLYHVIGYAAGLCVLLDREGKPFINKYNA